MFFFYTTMQQTELNKDDFNKANKKMAKYRYNHDDIFYEEHPEGDYVSGLEKAYFTDNQYLEIHFGNPEMNSKAQKDIHDALKYIKMLIIKFKWLLIKYVDGTTTNDS